MSQYTIPPLFNPTSVQVKPSTDALLLVKVSKLLYPINKDILYGVFSPYGPLERIEVDSPSSIEVTAHISYYTRRSATLAFISLHGKHIYNDCCVLGINFPEMCNDMEVELEVKGPPNCQAKEPRSMSLEQSSLKENGISRFASMNESEVEVVKVIATSDSELNLLGHQKLIALSKQNSFGSLEYDITSQERIQFPRQLASSEAIFEVMADCLHTGGESVFMGDVDKPRHTTQLGVKGPCILVLDNELTDAIMIEWKTLIDNNLQFLTIATCELPQGEESIENSTCQLSENEIEEPKLLRLIALDAYRDTFVMAVHNEEPLQVDHAFAICGRWSALFEHVMVFDPGGVRDVTKKTREVSLFQLVRFHCSKIPFDPG